MLSVASPGRQCCAIWRPSDWRLTRPGHWPGLPLCVHSSSVPQCSWVSVVFSVSQWTHTSDPSDHCYPPVTTETSGGHEDGHLIDPGHGPGRRGARAGLGPRHGEWQHRDLCQESGVSRESQPAPALSHCEPQGRAGPGIDCWVGSPPPLPAHSHLYHTYKPLPL